MERTPDTITFPVVDVARLELARRPMTPSEAAAAFMHACLSVGVDPPAIGERPELDTPLEW
jgi:hypothetical protein